MTLLKRPLAAVLFISLLPQLGGCTAHRTTGLRPEPSHLVGVSTVGGSVLMFDTLPAPQMRGDTVYAARGGAAYAIPKADVAALWMVRPGERPVAVATAGLARATEGAPPAPTLQVGQRVRVTIPSAGMDRYYATLEATSADTLVLSYPGPQGDTIRSRVPLESVRSVEVYLGRRSYLGPGTVPALVFVGAAVGALIGSRSGGTNVGIQPGLGEVGGAIGLLEGALYGAGCGLLTGLIARTVLSSEHWINVPLDRVRPTLRPLPSGRLGLGASLAF